MGNQEAVLVANGQIPGPTIVVYENQELIIKVKNELSDLAFSVHWHGMYQKGTPYMDGSLKVSHCPIFPQQEFSYRFIANPKGTHFWHIDSSSLKITYQAIFSTVIRYICP